MSQRFGSRRFNTRFAAIMLPALLLGACGGGGGAIQPDRSVFSLDGNYQRCQFGYGIEETFDRTVRVFKEAGYRLDVADRATGQISGVRGVTGNQSSSDKGLKVFALVLPTPNGQSQVGVKIVQIIQHGSVISRTRTEIIVNDPQLYQYMFRRIADIDNGATTYTAPPEATPVPQKGGANWDSYGAQPKPYGSK